ncbi:MAG TPA: DUF4388 domain-containing protein [Acidobacteriota bacterium]|nr:DUF4388 domain-containing protein [Acidobacteriota bacterium]
MAIEGNLSDMTLTGVVQFICLERRTAELILIRRGEEGSIFFEKGEISCFTNLSSRFLL